MSPSELHEFELTNGRGCRIRFLNLGGIITSIEVPDRDGVLANVALNYARHTDYQSDDAYHGAIVGRYANRIGGARFTLDHVEYRLSANDGRNTLHGGKSGFNRVLWSVEQSSESRAVLKHSSEDGDQGFPGRVDVTVTYDLSESNDLSFTFEAATTRPCPVNLCQHTYFNLSGNTTSSILDHELTINASHFTPVDGELIPTGDIRPVRSTPFDFTVPAPIGARIDLEDEQLLIGNGYDHNLIVDAPDDGSLAHAATLHDPRSGRVMDVHTTEPGIQVYTGNHLTRHPRRSGIALETQHFPDSPNKPEFPSTILRPGDRYFSQTVYRFRTRDHAEQV